MARAPWQLCPLEPRFTPAGNVLSTIVGTTLLLTGTDDTDSLRLRDDGMGVTVIAFGGTTIDSAGEKSFAGPIDSIKILGKGGDDTVALDDTNPFQLNGLLDIDLGDSGTTTGNSFELIINNDFSVGSLRLKAGEGRDVAILQGGVTTILGNIKADFGNESASLTIHTGTTIHGNLLVKSGAGPSQLALDGVTVKKNLTVAAGDGYSVTELLGFSTIEGNVAVTGGVGLDSVGLSGTTIVGPKGLTVKGGRGAVAVTVSSDGTTFTQGGFAVQSLDDDATLTIDGPALIAGAVNVRGRAARVNLNGGLDAGTLTVNGLLEAIINTSGTTTGLGVAKNVRVVSPTGLAALLMNNGVVSVNGNLVVSGTTDATLQLTNSGGNAILGNVAVAAKQQSATIEQSGGSFEVTGALTVTGGGSASATLAPSYGSVAKNVLVRGGAEFTRFTTIGTMTYDRNLTVLGGSGPTSVDMTSFTASVNGNLTMTTGSGADDITLRGLALNGLTTIKTNGGGDTVNLDGRVIFNAAVSIDTGTGDDTLALAQATGLVVNAVTFNQKASMSTGAGNDRLLLGQSVEAGGDNFSQVNFAGAGSVIDGGTNLNTFDDESGQFLGTPSLLQWTEPPIVG